MDPLTALSLAGNVVQFVDFGCQLLSHSRELYRSPRGSLAADDEIHLVTVDLRALILKLRNTPIMVVRMHRKTSEKYATRL